MACLCINETENTPKILQGHYNYRLEVIKLQLDNLLEMLFNKVI